MSMPTKTSCLYVTWINFIFSSQASEGGGGGWGEEGQIPQHINYGIYEDVSDKVPSFFQILELFKPFPLNWPTASLSHSWPANVSTVAFQNYPSFG